MSSTKVTPMKTVKKQFLRGTRLSSNPDDEITAEKAETILSNNKLFPHLYEPFYERKDVKSKLTKFAAKHRREQSMKENPLLVEPAR